MVLPFPTVQVQPVKFTERCSHCSVKSIRERRRHEEVDRNEEQKCDNRKGDRQTDRVTKLIKGQGSNLLPDIKVGSYLKNCLGILGNKPYRSDDAIVSFCQIFFDHPSTCRCEMTAWWSSHSHMQIQLLSSLIQISIILFLAQLWKCHNAVKRLLYKKVKFQCNVKSFARMMFGFRSPHE